MQPPIGQAATPPSCEYRERRRLKDMRPIRLIEGHRYVALANLPEKHAALAQLCSQSRLSGSIVLSIEGIDVRVAGENDDIDQLLSVLRGWPEHVDLDVREQRCERSPYRRMLVRVRSELIRSGDATLNPALHPPLEIEPAELYARLQAGSAGTLLDVRNVEEIAQGAFIDSKSLRTHHFHEFSVAIDALSPKPASEPIVIVCDDGLRSAKATLLLQRRGFEQARMLKGGIRAYLDVYRGDYFQGECVASDPRAGWHATRTPTQPPEETTCVVPIKERETQLRSFVDPLPGSEPHDQFRPVTVPAACDGHTLLETLCSVVSHAPERYWLDRFEQGLLLDDRGQPCRPQRIVRAGEKFLHRFANVIEPPVNMDIRLLHEEALFIVIDKPAPLPMHAGGRFHRNSLMYVLDALYAPEKLRPSHRLDANTTGALVIARTQFAAKKIQTQFARGTVGKRYLVRVHGHPPEDSFECTARISGASSEVGSRLIDEQHGQAAHTRFQVLMRFADGTSLLEAEPLTGRTNQIRLHLWHLGFPVRGDSVYLRDGEIGDRQTLEIDAPPMCLHAWRLEFDHPLTRERIRFEAPPPSWAEAQR